MKVLLTTLHAKFIHASLALPCLKAATDDIPGVRSVIREFTVNEPRAEVLRAIVSEQADIVAFSCYIWNIEAVTKIAADLKILKPETLLVAGGPEVSYCAKEFLSENNAFDCVIRGEGEKTWGEFLSFLQRNGSYPLLLHGIPPGLAYREATGIHPAEERDPMENLDEIPSPFALNLVDTTKPLVYYETSRGCPFTCAFCLSSLEKKVRSFSMERIRKDILYLIEKKVRIIKLVDRTFNYDPERANKIWEFILMKNTSSTFHFEIAADLLTEKNLRTLAKVPKEMFRFEIGVQTASRESLSRVARKSDPERLLKTVKRLSEETGVTIHLDLVAGLPGENLSGFLSSLGRLFPVTPHHIQVEPLKVLKGSPMKEIALREGYAFSAAPPYTILRTPDLSFEEINHIEKISRMLDLYFNSGRFTRSLFAIEENIPLERYFDGMARFQETTPGSGRKSLKDLYEFMWRFGKENLPVEAVAGFRDALCYDFCLGEYPTEGILPSFFPKDWRAVRDSLSKQTIEEFRATVKKAPGSRVRAFTARFLSDHRTLPPIPGPTELVFVYNSTPGRGLRVEIFLP